MDTHTQQDKNNPINWEGENTKCSECQEELTMNDYSDICNECFNKEEEEEEETKTNVLLYSYLNKTR